MIVAARAMEAGSGHVSQFDWIMIGLTVLSVLLIPALVVLVRGAIKWTRTEDKLSNLVEDVTQLVANKDATHADLVQQMTKNTEAEARVHAEILEQMRVDRQATDRRLRYIEEFWMEQGRKAQTG